MNKYLPIGSIVRLPNNPRKVMITGYKQILNDGIDCYDYCGVIFPEGYLRRDQNVVFDHDMIEDILFLGFQNEDYRGMQVELLGK